MAIFSSVTIFSKANVIQLRVVNLWVIHQYEKQPEGQKFMYMYSNFRMHINNIQ
jgi:hypothetical protein